MIMGTYGTKGLRINTKRSTDPMVTEAESTILSLAARVLGSEHSAWTQAVEWRPALDLAIRSARAAGGWLAAEGSIHVVTGRGKTLPESVEDWIEALAAGGAPVDDERDDLRAIGVPIDANNPSRGTVGLLLPVTGGGRPEVRATVRDVAKCVRGYIQLWERSVENSDSRETLRVLLRAISNMQLGLTLTDAEGRIVYTNPAEAAMHGYEPAELIGQPGSILAPPGLVKQGVEPTRRRGETRWTRESVNRHRDGHDFPVLLWSDMIRDQNGEFLGTVTCSENLAPRRAMEAALQRSETMFRAIFDNAPVGLALLGHGTWIIRANPRLAAMLSLEGESEPESRLMDFLHPDDASTALDFYNAVLRGELGKAPRLDHRMVPLRGGNLWVQATLSPITDSAGREQLWIALIEDTTKRRSLEEELRHSQKMEAVGRLAGGVAHDFNNLLTAIVGIAELLLLEAGRSHPMADDIAEIHRTAVTAADLTRQLLAFSRRQITHHQVQNLNSIVRDSENMFRRLVGDEIELTLDLGADLDPIVGDQSQLEQVILNLLVNARDAIPRGGQIELATRNVRSPQAEIELPPSRAFVELVVSDTGTGMDAATLEHIFDPFFTTKPKGRGTGLGLSTVYGIVKQSGGHIWVDSVVGQGSVFRIWFPAIRAGDPAPGIAPPPPTVLILIENAASHATLVQALHDAGVRVLAPDDAEDAVAMADTYGDRIDLLLVDDEVHGVSGTDLGRRLRALREEMRVLVLGGGHELADPDTTVIEATSDPAAILAQVRTILQNRDSS